MKIAVIGAGLTGLTAAYRLAQKGHRVAIFEKEKQVGGLAVGSRFRPNWDWPLENFFHHLFTSDRAAQNLIAELELKKKLFYSRPKTSLFYQGKINQFDSPLSVLKFPYLSPGEKMRVGLITAYLKFKTPPRWKMEKTTASQWLSRFYGQKAYRLLWQPLLRAKFGGEANRISMVWFWARIKKRSAQLGYLEGGFQALIDKLVKQIEEKKGKIILDKEIKNFDDLDNRSNFDRIIVTAPMSSSLKMIPNLPQEYREKLQKLKMIGALNLILVLKEPFLVDDTYWLNINAPDFPFVAVVEHTNFIDPKHYGGDHLLYVGSYYPQNHRYFKMKKERIFKEFLPYLQKINPSVSPITYYLSRNLFAQPIISTNYSRMIPSLQTPLSNLYLANMQMVYPWDRGVNYAIEMGNQVAQLVQTT